MLGSMGTEYVLDPCAVPWMRWSLSYLQQSESCTNARQDTLTCWVGSLPRTLGPLSLLALEMRTIENKDLDGVIVCA